ncbi:MAG: protein kinase [Polyangiaceae bacterium]|nr:protein kinase [Polyangiaceae bacterium]
MVNEPPRSLLRARLDRFQTLYNRLRTRAIVLIVMGTIGGIIGLFLLFLALLLLVAPADEEGLWGQRGTMFVALFGGLIPTSLSATAFWRGFKGRKRAHIARDIVALARMTPVFGSRDVAHHLGLHAMEAERAVLDAVAYGFVEEVPAEEAAALLAAAQSSGASGPQMASWPPGAITSPSAQLAPTGPAYPIAAQGAQGVYTPIPADRGAMGAANAITPQPHTPIVITPASPFVGSTTVQAPSPRVGPSAPPPPSVEALIGTVLNNTYAVEKHLGSGGMGAVYAAKHLRTGRRYAIKTLLPDAQVDGDAIRRFEREAMAASALGHPGIVAVHDFHVTDGGLSYLVMDLLEGETLDGRLARVGSLAWPDARRMILEAGDALAAAHEAGLLHRDLKPANLFVAKGPGGRERVVLVDFGLAKKIDSAAASKLTSTGAAVGTPLYMAPEQARGEPLDVRCDVYGLGAVLYEMLTGAPPFFDRTLAAVYAKLLTESAPSAVRAAAHPVPAIVDDLLACALAKAPGERFDSVRAFMGAIANVPANADVKA